MARRTKTIWMEIQVIEVLRQLKRQKSAIDNKDYSDSDILKMIFNDPDFKMVKEKLLKGSGMNEHLKVKVDKRRLI